MNGHADRNDEFRPILTQQEPSEYGSLFSRSESDVSFNPRDNLQSAPSFRPSEPATLSWRGLNVHVSQEKSVLTRKPKGDYKQILNNVMGVVKPGELVALMGASGAGKTTLLNVLTFRNVAGLDIDGSVMLNGVPADRKQVTAMSAYVQQDDIFFGTLTVKEHLTFQALLRLPPEMSRRGKLQRVDDVIRELGLSRCRHTKIGLEGVYKGISGGEMKRLAFASAVLTNPSILFCDEPTTGLDAFMAESVVQTLQGLAVKQKTILCTIHQPASEVYFLFDRLILLAEGRVAFCGSAKEVLPFFDRCGYPSPKNFNPADHFINVLAVEPGKREESIKRIEAVCSNFETSTYHEDLEQQVAKAESNDGSGEDGRVKLNPYKTGWIFQFIVLLWRSLLNNFRNPRLVLIRLGQKLGLALFTGCLYSQLHWNQAGLRDVSGFLFFLLAEISYPTMFGILMVMGVFVALLYSGNSLDQRGIKNTSGVLYFFQQTLTFPVMMGVVSTFPLEFPVIVREHHDGMYRISSFYVSKIVSNVPSFMFDGILFVLLTYFWIGLRQTAAAFFSLLGLCILIEQVAAAFGSMMSAVSPSIPIAFAIIGPVVTLLSILGGLYTNVGVIPVYLSWAQYLSWFRYGFEAMSITQWHGVHNITCETTAVPCITDGDAVLANLSFYPGNLVRDCLLMITLGLGFHAVGFTALLIRVTKAR